MTLEGKTMMEGFGAGVILFLAIALYPLVALGRIWLYSNQQVELLKQIEAALSER